MFVDALIPFGTGSAWRTTLEALESWTSGKVPSALFRINPLAVADKLGTDSDLTVDAFLAGVLDGWFDLRWDYHCPQCQGIPGFTSHLSNAKAEGFCPMCKVGFRNQLDTNVEVTFTAAPKLAAFAPGEQDRLLASFNKSLTDGTWVPPKRVLSGMQLLHRPLFHERFSDEVLSAEESLEIRQVALLFTDIRGSTKLYEELGDAKAYNLVREHFKVLFRAVEAHQGIVVKTIGDAVMGSFRRPADALAAALDVQEEIELLKVPGTNEAVVVKMGLHTGPAIAVTLNDRFDYFGQTVNRAARIQGLATAQQIFFSESIVADTEVRRLLAPRKAAIRKWKTRLKGIEGDQIVYSVD